MASASARLKSLEAEIGQQFGGVLDLVDQDGRHKAQHEEGGIGLRQFEHERIVERDIRVRDAAQVPEQRRLADLPCAGEQHDEELLRGTGYEGFRASSVPSILHGECILAGTLPLQGLARAFDGIGAARHLGANAFRLFGKQVIDQTADQFEMHALTCILLGVT
jgi:hypothetical protein